MKHPKFNAKKTHAVTERVIRSWCGVSTAYLLSVEACQRRAAELRARGAEDLLASSGLGEHSGSYSTVAHDSLMYGMEMTLKAAQMIDGYHDLGVPPTARRVVLTPDVQNALHHAVRLGC